MKINSQLASLSAPTNQLMARQLPTKFVIPTEEGSPSIGTVLTDGGSLLRRDVDLFLDDRPKGAGLLGMMCLNGMAEFDQLVFTPSKHTKGGDYYIQHQGQLQNSALSFNPLNNKNPQSDFSLSTIEHNEVNHELGEVNYDMCQNSQEQQVTRISIQIDALPGKDVKELTPILEQTMTSVANTGNSEPKNELIASKTVTLKNQIKQPEIVFKTHQLFVGDNTVELTLSTTYLSKQQTHELKKLIKQWVADKGLTIKQWIINGEQQ